MTSVVKNKVFILAIAVFLLAAIAIQGSLAYFLAKSPIAENVVSFGEVKMEIFEEDWIGDATVTPGATIPKNPSVKNTGSVNAYIRLIVSGTENYTLDYNLEYWNQEPTNSGIWYYKSIVSPGKSTVPLFTKITLNPSYNGDRYDLDIVIYGEAIQAAFVDNKAGTGSAANAIDAFKIFDKSK
ncbi:MAG: hypothetical protein LBT59_24315 [Clostridiales bacterium]|jgi:hypothetical protein|nr:hypothetical protein [Clostridiales bacterium]